MTARTATISKGTGLAISIVIPLLTGVFWLTSDRTEIRSRTEQIAATNERQEQAIAALQKAFTELNESRMRVETSLSYIEQAVRRIENATATARRTESKT